MLLDLPPEFDVGLYIRHPRNPDLAEMDESEARGHYEAWGRREGRTCSAVDSRQAFLELVPSDADILEIGPFFAPCFRKPEHNVQYMDILPTEGLRERAAGISGVNAGRVPQIDFVWTGQSYPALIGPQKFAAVFSSHTIGHHPCLVTHLADVRSVLASDGRYFVVVPDKRYCLGHFIPEATVADILDALLAKRPDRHAFSSILNYSLAAHNDSARHWEGDHGQASAMEVSNAAVMARLSAAISEFRNSPGYIDTQAWHFTPSGFRGVIAVLAGLGLIDLRVERIYPTVAGSNEFYAVLAALLPEDFEPQRYLELNPDVFGTDPTRHWKEFGFWEGRRWR
jgi:hypothetical protein